MTLKSQEETAGIMSRIQARKTTMGQIYRTPCVIIRKLHQRVQAPDITAGVCVAVQVHGKGDAERAATMGQIYRTPCVIRNGPGNTFLVELNENAADASKSVGALRNRGADIKGPEAERGPIVTALSTRFG